MKISTINKSKFAYQVYLRGQEYEEIGNVSLSSVSPTHVEAIVDGTKPYEVSISFDGNGHIKTHRCSCPYHESFRPCKHIAAVLFALDNLEPSQMFKSALDDPIEEKNKFKVTAKLPRSEFADKCIEIFNSIIDIDQYDFQAQAKNFFSACYNIYGYRDAHEQAEALLKIYTGMNEGQNKRYFLSLIVEHCTSVSASSIFFAKALYKFDLNKQINDFLGAHPKYIEKFNPDFVNALNPANVFAYMENNVLELFADNYYFSYDIDREYLIEACEEKKATGALKRLLQKTHLGKTAYSDRIMKYLAENEQGSKLALYIVGLPNGTVSKPSFLKAFIEAPKEEQVKYYQKAINACLYNESFVTAMKIAMGLDFTITELNRVTTSMMLPIISKIFAKGDSFIIKAMPKYIERQAKRLSYYYTEDPSFTDILALINAFASYPEVAMILLEDNIYQLSITNMVYRRQYLTLCHKLGLLGRKGIHPYFEV